MRFSLILMALSLPVTALAQTYTGVPTMGGDIFRVDFGDAFSGSQFLDIPCNQSPVRAHYNYDVNEKVDTPVGIYSDIVFACMNPEPLPEGVPDSMLPDLLLLDSVSFSKSESIKMNGNRISTTLDIDQTTYASFARGCGTQGGVIVASPTIVVGGKPGTVVSMSLDMKSTPGMCSTNTNPSEGDGEEDDDGPVPTDSVDIVKCKTRVDVKKLKVSKTPRAWPNGLVVYEIDETVAGQKNAILAAMKEWEDKTKIRFVPRTNELEFLRFFRTVSPIAWSELGKKRRLQLLGLAPETSIDAIVHEIGHTLGFQHEQQRADRDYYIDIEPAKINPDYACHFQLTSHSLYRNWYDRLSIMQYPANAYSLDGRGFMTFEPVGYARVSDGSRTSGPNAKMKICEYLSRKKTLDFEACLDVEREILKAEIIADPDAPNVDDAEFADHRSKQVVACTSDCKSLTDFGADYISTGDIVATYGKYGFQFSAFRSFMTLTGFPNATGDQLRDFLNKGVEGTAPEVLAEFFNIESLDADTRLMLTKKLITDGASTFLTDIEGTTFDKAQNTSADRTYETLLAHDLAERLAPEHPDLHEAIQESLMNQGYMETIQQFHELFGIDPDPALAKRLRAIPLTRPRFPFPRF